MKYCLVVPTYHAHYNQVDILLNSFSINCLDKNIIPIRLIISKYDENLFNQLVNKYDDLDLKCEILSNIIKNVDNQDIDENILLGQTGKYNFQSIKKLYGAKIVNADITLVTDSESILVKPCYFEDIFLNFQKNKFIIHSKMHKKQGNIQAKITNGNFARIFQTIPEDKWFLDSQYWFYEKNILNDFFNKIKNIHNKFLYQLMIGTDPTFDFALYSTYIYLHNNYGYKFLDMDKIIENKMGNQKYRNYLGNSQASTAFEYFIWDLTNDNFELFKEIYSEYELLFFKYDDRFRNNQLLQQQFVQETNIKMLSCRVTCDEFEINGFKIPVNHKNNQPILK